MLWNPSPIQFAIFPKRKKEQNHQEKIQNIVRDLIEIFASLTVSCCQRTTSTRSAAYAYALHSVSFGEAEVAVVERSLTEFNYRYGCLG